MTLLTPFRKTVERTMLAASACLLIGLSAFAQPGRQAGGYGRPAGGMTGGGPRMGGSPNMGGAQRMGGGGMMGAPRPGGYNGGPAYGSGYPGSSFQGNAGRVVGPTPQQGNQQRFAGPAQPQAGAGQQRFIGPVQQGGQAGQPVRGEHLGQWMQQHSNLNPQQQQRALQNEPGFNRLAPQQQNQVMNRLNRLNTMPQQQRERVIQRAETMEHMSPQQRGNVRSAMGQLGALPEDRRRMVARSFRDLRQMPVQQRNSMLNSPEYRQQFTDEERGTLGNLLSVEPLLPGR
ncbi:DUF3106 domain-containing protein [Terriglobus roseus]|uniref:DUF3106 domain-containing protein n=1 Tax=Terriglobus roseus TaxID=392734 RepID=A0A1H4SB49_9BACT|nr:DUF3106 domain-containing protein [Terriglobus roseus]SEC41270.1 Protein of unknown function [Terriglobus roseus]